MQTRWNNLPLGYRLTLLYVGLLILLLGVFGSLLYFDTRNFLIRTTAFRLEAIANSALNRITPGEPPPPAPNPSGLDARTPITPTRTFTPPPFEVIARNLARDLTWQDTTAVVIERAGTRWSDDRETTEPRVQPTPDPGLLARAFTGETITFTANVTGLDLLTVLIPVPYPRTNTTIAGVIQMSIPLGPVEDVLGRQRTLIIGGVSAALLVATLGGLWLTQTALRPLQVMIAVCRRIAGGDLSQRVNLPQRRDETGQLAAAFDEMVARLEDAFTMQRQFVADASHELRTPLTAISGSLEVLLMAPEGDPEMARRVLHGMRREVQRLTRLVTDLLTLTRLDARRRPNPQVVDLATLAREVIEGMRALAKNRALTLETEGNTQGYGDADQLKQVFYNLLGNAIQATDAEQGKIILRVQGAAQTVQVSVVDNGGGIPEPAQAHIFERFYRVDKARARASGGSGLGLAIVRAIVESHAGHIEPVESAVGRGTTIRFTLPRAQN